MKLQREEEEIQLESTKLQQMKEHDEAARAKQMRDDNMRAAKDAEMKHSQAKAAHEKISQKYKDVQASLHKAGGKRGHFQDREASIQSGPENEG